MSDQKLIVSATPCSGSNFKSVFSLIKTTLERVTITFTPKGMRICQDNHTNDDVKAEIMFIIEMDETRFNPYVFSSKKPKSFSISVSSMVKSLTNLKKKDKMTFSIHKVLASGIHRMKIEIQSEKAQAVESHTDLVNKSSSEEFLASNSDDYEPGIAYMSATVSKMKKHFKGYSATHVFFQDRRACISTSSRIGEGSAFVNDGGNIDESKPYLNLTFKARIFVDLITKISSLSSNIYFHCPANSERMPLKILSNSEIGQVNVYIKDEDLIRFEQENEAAKELPTPAPKATRKTAPKAKKK
jgi:hypothetical protein